MARPPRELRSSAVPRRLRPSLGALLFTLAFGPLYAACDASSSTTTSSGSTNGTGGADTGTGTGGSGEGGIGLTNTTSSSSSSSSATGTGGEGGMNPCEPDADGDGMPDEVEGSAQKVDTDKDGTPDYKDTDSDGDTIPDAFEGQAANVGCKSPLDSDGDGTPDYRDTDSDENGLNDRDEIYPDGSAFDAQKPAPNPADTDGDGAPDYVDLDNDDDALPDTIELVGSSPFDTDLDGFPDLDDVDSDGDTIADAFEQLVDPDGDSLPAFRDQDSDGDGRSDLCEAGPGHNVASPPIDRDSDSKYDFLDKDSDNDGLLDNVEDANQSCSIEADETDPHDVDTDDDGANDLVESLLGSNPKNPIQTPASLGKYYFLMPYLDDPWPAKNSVPLKTNPSKGDVAFIVDTTATMGGAIQNLKQGLSGIIQSLYGSIPDLAVGVAGHDDFPSGNYGTAGVDMPFYLAGQTGYLSTVPADSFNAVQTLGTHDGGDFPESQVAAYYRALTDEFLIWNNGQIPPNGVPGGMFGTLRFRQGSLPIVVGITDASFHNGRRANNPNAVHDAYSFPSPTADQLVTKMKALGARYLGISVSGGSRNGADPYEDMAYLVDEVGSLAPPSAFGGALCGTGLSGSFISPDGPITPTAPNGTCRLIFDVAKNGGGLSNSVVNGVLALLKSIRLDVRIVAEADQGAIDAVDTFVQSIGVNAQGGNDPAEPGAPCVPFAKLDDLADFWDGPKGTFKIQDGVNETALGVTPTTKICFNITPLPNTSVPQTDEAQVYTAILKVRAKNGASPFELPLGTPRSVAFIVPPAPQ